jgi:hypothetical protein
MTTYNSPFAGDVVQPTDVSYAAFITSTDIVLQWPVNGNSSTNVAARVMEVTANAANLKMYMPPANQVSVGNDALISVLAGNNIDVVSYNGDVICTVQVGKSQYIYVTDNSTEDGTWGVIAFGATTSSANAATLAGSGLLASSNTLNQSHPSASATAGQTFSGANRAQTVIWSGGAASGTLPVASSLGDNWFMLFKNSGTGTYSIACTGSDTVDGVASKSFAPNESAFIVCTGSSYVTIGYGVSNLFAFTALVKPVTSGTYTLTSAEASSTIQEFVGTLTGNVIAVYPQVVNLYVISNQVTAGGYTLTIKTNAVGAATVTVPAGQQATLICDGTNFYNANTVQIGATSITLINGTVTNPALSFSAETNTGMYRPGAGQIGFSILGTDSVVMSTTGMSVVGSGTFTTGIKGGAF